MQYTVDIDYWVKLFTIISGLAQAITLILLTIQIKSMNKGRETDITIRIFDRFCQKDFVEAHDWIFSNICDNKSGCYDFYTEGGIKIRKLSVAFEEVGSLTKIGAIDKKTTLLLLDSLVVKSWEKCEEFLLKERVNQNDHTLWENFEYLRDEAKEFIERGRPDGR